MLRVGEDQHTVQVCDRQLWWQQQMPVRSWAFQMIECFHCYRNWLVWVYYCLDMIPMKYLSLCKQRTSIKHGSWPLQTKESWVPPSLCRVLVWGQWRCAACNFFFGRCYEDKMQASGCLVAYWALPCWPKLVSPSLSCLAAKPVKKRNATDALKICKHT